MNPLLAVEGITKSFRGLRAVANVCFTIEPGSIVALIGPNGAGKTTLFNLIAGAVRPDTGKLFFAGNRIDGLRPDQVCALGIGRTFQIVKPFNDLTVLDNVIVGALQRCSSVASARSEAESVLEPLDLLHKRNLPAADLTLPERKRLEVARALATRPHMLLLDEVMGGLRPAECDRLVSLFREINQRDGVTIVLIEHVMRAVMALARHIVVLHQGEVIAQGPPAKVVNDPAVLQCYLGEDTDL